MPLQDLVCTQQHGPEIGNLTRGVATHQLCTLLVASQVQHTEYLNKDMSSALALQKQTTSFAHPNPQPCCKLPKLC